MNKYKLLLLFATISLSLTSFSFAGGGSDGGGNTYRGKPLESYAKNPLEMPAFKNFIAPILADIDSKKSNDNHLDVLKNLMLSVFQKKIWYFVPGPLEHIPKDLLDSAVRTDQAALQGFERLWIDESIWNRMDVEDQAKLLLHETFMGLKILKFASSYRLCSAAYPQQDSCIDNESMDSPILLKASDYVDVQKMTIQSFSSYVQMNNNDWVRLLKENNVKFSYGWFDEVTIIKSSDLGALLKKSSMAGFLPTIGYNLRSLDSETGGFSSRQEMYEYLQNHKETCNVSANVVGQQLHLKLKSNSESFEGNIDLPLEIQTSYADSFKENRNIKRIDLSYPTGQPRAGGGYTTFNIFLGFESYKLSHVYIQEMVCEDADCSGVPPLDVRGGMLFICSDNKQLFKP